MRRSLQAAAVLCAFGMLALAALFIQGSSDMFPTDEQDGKARIALGLLFAFVSAAEAALLWFLRRSALARRP